MEATVVLNDFEAVALLRAAGLGKIYGSIVCIFFSTVTIT